MVIGRVVQGQLCHIFNAYNNHLKKTTNMKSIQYLYNQHEIAFLHNDNKVMVNATQMAKIFEKRIENFTRIESTQNFIDECLKTLFGFFLQIENKSDLITQY